MYTLISDTVAEFGPLTRIQIRFTHGGWIHAYLDSDAGTLLLTSDWGDWTHRWGLAGIPACGFVEFICDRNRDKWMWHYVANKLMYGREDRVLDVRATQSHLRRRLAEAYRRHPRTDAEARMYVEAIDDIDRMERFEDVYDSESIGVFYSVDTEDILTMPSPEIVRLRDFILPAVGAAYARYRSAEAA